MVWLLYGWLKVPIIALKLASPVWGMDRHGTFGALKQAPPSAWKKQAAKVEVDGFFTLPHAQESRFSSILAADVGGSAEVLVFSSTIIYPYLPTFMEDTYLRQVLANEIV